MKKLLIALGLGIFLIFSILLLVLFRTQGSLTIFDETKTTTSYEQINGIYDPDIDPENYFSGDNPIATRQVLSETAIIGEYRIVTQKRDSFTHKFFECKTKPTGNVRSVTETRIDDDGCTRWDYVNTLASYSAFCGRGSGAEAAIKYGYSYCRYATQAEIGISCSRNALFCWNEKKVLDFGGTMEATETEYQCFGKYEVYKSNELIHDIDWTSQKNIQIEENGLFMTFNQNSVYWSSSRYDPVHWKCLRLNSNYEYKVPSGSLNIEILPIEDVVYKGDELKAKIKVTNNWKPIKANLSVLFEVSTIIGNAEKIESSSIDIIKGEQIFEYNIPTNETTERLSITPELLIYEETSSFSGLNTMCNGIKQNIAKCDKIVIEKFIGDKVNTKIIEKPTVVNPGAESCGDITCPEKTRCNKVSDTKFECIEDIGFWQRLFNWIKSWFT